HYALLRPPLFPYTTLFRSGRGVVDRRWDAAFAQREEARDRLERAGRAQQMAAHGFRRRDHELVGVVAEHLLDGRGLLAVVRLGRGPVRVDVVDVARIQAGLAERHTHRA